MTKKEIAKYVASCAGVNKAKAERCINCYHKAIPGALKRGERVIFRDFGSFSATKKSKSGKTSENRSAIEYCGEKSYKVYPEQ